MKKYILCFLTLWVLSCGGDSGSSVSYSETVERGATALNEGSYAEAIKHFSEAVAMHADRPEAFAGLGWAYLFSDSVEASEAAFSDGSMLANPGADLQAGYAFLLGVQKNHETSNARIVSVLAAEPQWSLSYGLNIDYKDLYLLKAENHFLLGEYSQSVLAVKQIQSSFIANTNTAEGIAQLAAKIESLKLTTEATPRSILW
ncbi:tetratricopeptide repeat protein [bacterium]|nr:tetratricopeptide repeat protein [bacterium]NUN45417.1 tetratricopeptide repeat protein [bacterium]